MSLGTVAMPAETLTMVTIGECIHIHEIHDDGRVNCLIQLAPEHVDLWIKQLWAAKQQIEDGETDE